MKFGFWHEGLTFIGIFLFMVGVPCLIVAFLGTRLIDHLGQYPSRSAKLQMNVCVQLLLTEILTFGMLALFYHIFSD